jgi:hypothetical protein
MMLATTLLLASLAAGPLAAQPRDADGGPIAKLDRADRLLLGEGASSAEIRAGFLVLLEVMAEAAPPSAGPGGTCGAKIGVVRVRVGDGSILDRAGVALLDECYRDTHGGQPFAVPSSVRSVADARNYARRQIEGARTLLSEGRGSEAVSALLQTALLIVTPMER